MKKRTLNIVYLSDIILLILFALVPTLIFNGVGFYEDMELYLSLTYWISFALSILVVLGFVMYCFNRPNKMPKVWFWFTESFALLFLITPNICMFYLDGSYVTPLIINIVVLALFLISMFITSTLYVFRSNR
ncbi:MAG: hypothetical protein LUC31_01895 [Coprobacillus sp.]|nr:hypothetical protein [Coprobacillus sp.]